MTLSSVNVSDIDSDEEDNGSSRFHADGELCEDLIDLFCFVQSMPDIADPSLHTVASLPKKTRQVPDITLVLDLVSKPCSH